MNYKFLLFCLTLSSYNLIKTEEIEYKLYFNINNKSRNELTGEGTDQLNSAALADISNLSVDQQTTFKTTTDADRDTKAKTSCDEITSKVDPTKKNYGCILATTNNAFVSIIKN